MKQIRLAASTGNLDRLTNLIYDAAYQGKQEIYEAGNIRVVLECDLRGSRQSKIEAARQVNSTGWTLFVNKTADLCHAVHARGTIMHPPGLAHLKNVREKEHVVNWFLNQMTEMLSFQPATASLEGRVAH